MQGDGTPARVIISSGRRWLAGMRKRQHREKHGGEKGLPALLYRLHRHALLSRSLFSVVSEAKFPLVAMLGSFQLHGLRARLPPLHRFGFGSVRI